MRLLEASRRSGAGGRRRPYPSTGVQGVGLRVAVRPAEQREIVLSNHRDVGVVGVQHPLVERQGPFIGGSASL